MSYLGTGMTMRGVSLQVAYGFGYVFEGAVLRRSMSWSGSSAMLNGDALGGQPLVLHNRRLRLGCFWLCQFGWGLHRLPRCKSAGGAFPLEVMEAAPACNHIRCALFPVDMIACRAWNFTEAQYSAKQMISCLTPYVDDATPLLVPPPESLWTFRCQR